MLQTFAINLAAFLAGPGSAQLLVEQLEGYSDGMDMLQLSLELIAITKIVTALGAWLKRWLPFKGRDLVIDPSLPFHEVFMLSRGHGFESRDGRFLFPQK